MSRSLEITPIGTVVVGRVELAGDHRGGQAIIRLNPDFPVEVVLGRGSRPIRLPRRPAISVVSPALASGGGPAGSSAG